MYPYLLTHPITLILTRCVQVFHLRVLLSPDVLEVFETLVVLFRGGFIQSDTAYSHNDPVFTEYLLTGQ